MKKLMLVSLMCLPLFTSCKLLCPAVAPIATKFSNVIVDQCKCANAEQVMKDVTKVVNSALLCDNTQNVSGPIANVICPIAGSLVTGFIAGKIPQDWQCANSLGCVNNVVQIAVTACQMIPFQPTEE